MKIKFLIALCFITINSYASTGQQTDTTEFGLLKSLITNAAPVSYDQVKGLYTGSCYDKENPTLFRQSSLYVGEMSGAAVKKVVIEGGVNYGGRFTSRNRKDILEGLFKLSYGYKNLEQDPLMVTMAVDEEVEKHTWSFYQTGDLLIGYLTAGLTDNIKARGNGFVEVQNGEVWAACMYKIQDKL